jgi:hypothetical protein
LNFRWEFVKHLYAKRANYFFGIVINKIVINIVINKLVINIVINKIVINIVINKYSDKYSDK